MKEFVVRENDQIARLDRDEFGELWVVWCFPFKVTKPEESVTELVKELREA